MAYRNPVSECARGLRAFVRGLSWLRSHPKYLALVIAPFVAGFLVTMYSVGWLIDNRDMVIGYILFDQPEAWYLYAVWWLLYWLLFLAVGAIFGLGGYLFANIVLSPIHEAISVAVEREIKGQVEGELDLWGNVKVILVELKKVLLILFISVVMLFIPIVNIVATLIAAFLIGWDFFDFPAARRGWSLAERLRIAGTEFWSVMGFGLWLVIPGLQLFLIPLAAAGGTILSLEALERRKEPMG